MSEPLTRREIQVADMLSRGYGNKQIADELHISENTVETHRGNANRKLGVSSGAHLVRRCIEAGYLSVEVQRAV